MPCVTVKSKPSDGEHPVTDACRLVVTEGNSREVLTIDLDHRDVRGRITADDLRVELAPVGENHRHLVRVRNDVIVGEDQAILGDDEPRSRRVDYLIFRRLATLATLMTEGYCPIGEAELSKIREVRHLHPLGRWPRAFDVDRDDCRRHLRRDRGEGVLRLHERGNGRRAERAGMIAG